MSDELAKISLRELIAQGKLGQLDLKRGRKEVGCTQANHEIAEERIRKRKEKAKKMAKSKGKNINLKNLKIKPLTPQQQLDCDRLMRLYNFDIGKVAMELWVSPVVIQTYWLNKSKKLKAK